MKKRLRIIGLIIFSYILISCMMSSVSATTSAQHVTSSGNVFLGNAKMELGINAYGTFGSTVAAPSGFNPWSTATAIGLRSYPWSNTRDYFLPGTVDEGYVLAWATTSSSSPTQRAMAKSNGIKSVSQSSMTGSSTTDHSTSTLLSAVTNATAANTAGIRKR